MNISIFIALSIASSMAFGSEIQQFFQADSDLIEFIGMKERLCKFESGEDKITKDRSEIFNPYVDLRDSLYKKKKLVGVRVFCKRGQFEGVLKKDSLRDYYLFRDRDLEVGIPEDKSKNIVVTFDAPPKLVNRYISLVTSLIQTGKPDETYEHEAIITDRASDSKISEYDRLKLLYRVFHIAPDNSKVDKRIQIEAKIEDSLKVYFIPPQQCA